MIKNKTLNFIYFNKTFNKSRLKKLIYWSINLFGEKKTVDLIEILKKLGYSYSTKAGLSLSIDDLKVPLIKNKLLLNTESKLNYTNQDVEKGYLTSIEYFAQVIDVWNNTNDILKQEVINNFKIKDVLNPVYMMAFSGARGNISQVRQLVGMRGLMADPSGRIINFPIQSNFREGLTLTEYIISCYGARKGVVDTALRTATSGYLTRRLVDVAQHVIIRVYDCLTLRGIFLSDLKTNNNKKLLSLKNRLIGRVLAEDIYTILPKLNVHSFFTSKYTNTYTLKNKLKKTKIAIKNQVITTELVDILLKNKKSILVRSSLTCQDKNYVCQLCYGWSLSSNNLVSLGESVGIIAAQSIGEPGTQLTMRTFHTGGVFSGHSSNEIIAKFNGQIDFPQIINGKLVRTTHGKIAFLIKVKSFFLLKSVFTIKKINLPLFTLLFVKQGQKVYKNQVLAEPIGFITELEQSIDIFQTIYSEFAGEIFFKNSKSIEKFNKTNKKIDINLITNVNSKTGQLWVLASHKQIILKPLNLFVQIGDFIFLNSFISLYKFIFLNNIVKKNSSNLFFIKKKLEIFNFFNLIKNKNKLNESIIELNLFIKYDYFQFTKVIKKKIFNKNKFKILNDNYIIYSKINKDYINNKFRKIYYLSNFNITKNSYGLKYELVINLNSINKIILFENKIQSYYLPKILFYFCTSNQNKFKLLEQQKIIYYNYSFKIPFNFIFNLNYIYKNNFKFFYNLNIHKLNLNYKILFKLKNLKSFLNYIKYININSKKIKTNILNKKLFISDLNHFSINNSINITIKKNFLFNYFFFKNNIKSYFYENSCFYYKDLFLFNNINSVSYFYINNLITLFNNFNKNSSYLLFINSSLNFFILTIFYKIKNRINKNKYYSFKGNKINLIKKDYLIKLINFNIYFNKKKNIWLFYFLLPTLKTTISNNNFLNISTKIKNKNYLILIFKKVNIRKEKSLFFYNFSINIIKFYKQIKILNIIYLNEKLNLKKKQILLYNKNNFNTFNIHLLKSKFYYLNYFNYLFLSFLFYLNLDKNNKINLIFFNKITRLYYNQSFLSFNIKKIQTLILKNFISKQNNLIYFKIKNNFNYNLKENKLNKINNIYLFYLIYFLLFNINFLIKLKDLYKFNLLNIKTNKKEFNSILKIKELYRIENKINNFFLQTNKFNKKHCLYLKKEIIYFYFSSYIFCFLLFNIKINFFNYKKLYSLNFSKIILQFLKLEKIKKINNINSVSKNLKILYFFKSNINISNIKYNLIFYNIIFYKFIKNINLILIIFYKFIKNINNKKLCFFNSKITNNFFSIFSINNNLSYNNLFNLFFYYKNSIFDDFVLVNNININYLKTFYNKNSFYIFDKNQQFKNILFNKKQIEEIYFFLNKKSNLNFSISTIWFSKRDKLKTKFNYTKICKYKYYNLNNFKIKNNNKKFKILISLTNYNFNFLLSFKINYLNNKFYKKFFYYKSLQFVLIKNLKKIENIKIKSKNNINYKLEYFYFIINNKILNKTNYINFNNNIHKDIKSLNKFLNLLIKYENTINFINLNNIFKNKWIVYFNNLNLNTINIKLNFNFFYKIFCITDTKINKIVKQNYYNIKFFNQNKQLIYNKQNNDNFFIFKKYWIFNYFQRNILLFNKFNYYYNYWLFYKSNFILFNNKYNLKKILLLPIQTLYLFKIQSKLNVKKHNKSLILLYFLFNFNNNKKIEVKKNSLFNFFKLKYFNLKLKYFLTKYNTIYIEKIFLFNLNSILFNNLYNFKNYTIFCLKNKKLQKQFNLFFNIENNKYKKKNKLINYYNGWFYISNRSNFLFLNSKKIIPNGFFINKFILFENKIILNKFFTFRFKNIIFKNFFNFRIYLLKPFINFKIKKSLLNSIFIFYGSRFFNIYLHKSIIYFNNFIFNSYEIIKNQDINFSYINKWFILTKFYFYKIKLNCFIYNKKINNNKFNIKKLNNYCRILFLQTSSLKKVKNCLSFSIKSLVLIKHNILNKNNYLKKSFINSDRLINNFLIVENNVSTFKRLLVINKKKIFFNNYNRYKPKLLIYKIIFNSYNLKLKFTKFKNICVIQKGLYFNNLNTISKSLFFIDNKVLLSQNDLRYYILKFPFKIIIKRKKFKTYFISNKNEKIKNLFKLTYCNYLFLNKNKINLLNRIVFKNNKIKKYFYDSLLLFINKKKYKVFYNSFYFKGYKYFNKINKYKIIKNKKYLNKKYNYIFFIINKKNIIIFFIYNKKNNFKISKLYLVKNKENCFFNFNISNNSSIYFYKKTNNNYFNKDSNLTTKIIYKKFNTHILNFSKKVNINFYIKDRQNIKSENFISNIYINFKPFLIEQTNFLIQLNIIINIKSNNYLLLTLINKKCNNIFNKLKFIKMKIRKISINYNNYNNFNFLLNNKLNKKLTSKLSSFKGEVLNTYNLSFFYFNYLKTTRNIKTINNIFNFKYHLKEKISLFPEIFYLTNDDFLTYKITNKDKFKIKLGEFVSCSKEIILNFSINQSGQIIFLNKNKILLRRAKVLLLSAGCICNLKQGDFINNNSPLLTLTYKNLKTEDIVQGIPKIEQIFEARENLKDKFSLNALIKLKFKNYKKIYSKKEAVHRSIIFIQQYIVDAVQKVYQSQGVNISDKHIEIIVKQMTSKVKITDPGNTGLLRGDIVYLDWIELINNGLKSKKSQYEPIILGISKACLEMDGFISAASFQETIKILSKAAILQKRDFLRGLKENLILGHLVPVGTGFEFIN